jgi:addiction module RelE/StbE family toxin
LTQLVWTSAFTRAANRLVRRDPKLRQRIERTFLLLSQDAMDPALRSHKLKGELAGVWACSVDYDIRILYEFVLNPDTNQREILLLALGTHDEVY